MGKSTQDMQDLYWRMAKNVFCYRFGAYTKWITKGYFYDAERLEAILKEEFTEQALYNNSSFGPNVLAIATDVTSATSTPYIFRSYSQVNHSPIPTTIGYAEWRGSSLGENSSEALPIWQVCRASSAAPGYFCPLKLGTGASTRVYVDGGLVANNPIEMIIQEARKLWPNKLFGPVVSIGCGDVPSEKGGSRSILKWAGTVVHLATDSNKTYSNL